MTIAEAWIEWYKLAGVDEAVQDVPAQRFASPHGFIAEKENTAMARKRAEMPQEPANNSPATDSGNRVRPSGAASGAGYISPAEAVAEARALASAANSLSELRQAVEGFDGCALKPLATNTVFADGNPEADIMFIGEAPGAQDQQGIPFCGPSGQLLDKMLASIGLDRKKVYITNTVFWRPPGNRQPSKEELAICEPFLEKHIALMQPKLLVLTGGVAVSAVLKSKLAMSRLRGRLHDYENPMLSKPVPAVVFFHPAYLLRSPGQKKQAWIDLQRIRNYVQTGEF